MVKGMGGAMDLVGCCDSRVVVLMEHSSKVNKEKDSFEFSTINFNCS
jgi:acyl CoA:acetate/3-ketoacid CoA transferase beta subunit